MTKQAVTITTVLSDVADHKEFGMKNDDLLKLVAALNAKLVERDQSTEHVSVTVEIKTVGSLQLVTDLIDTIQSTMEKQNIVDTSFTFTDEAGEMTIELKDVAVADIV